ARMGAVDDVPRAEPPATEADLVGTKRFAIIPGHEPFRMLLEEFGVGTGDEGGRPQRGSEAIFSDGLQHLPYVTAKGVACIQPISHPRLVTVINLRVAQTGHVLLHP